MNGGAHSHNHVAKHEGCLAPPVYSQSFCLVCKTRRASYATMATQLLLWSSAALMLTVMVTVTVTMVAGLSDELNLDGGSYHVLAASCYERANCDANAETLRTLRAHVHNATAACENFWDYACGDWTAAPYYNHVDTFGAMANQFVGLMMGALWPASGGSDRDMSDGIALLQETTPELLSKMRTYFGACRAVSGYFMRLPAYLEQMPPMRAMRWSELRALMAALDERASDRASDRANDRASDRASDRAAVLQHFDWLLAVAELRRYGVNGIFFEQSIGWAYNDSARYVVQITPPTDAIAYFATRYEVLQLMLDFELVGEQREWQLQLADELYELDMQLRRLHAKQQTAADRDTIDGDDDDDDDDDDLDAADALTLQELTRRVPQIDWRRYFGQLLGRPTASLPDLLPLEVEGVAYLRDVVELLAHLPPHIVQLYVWLRLCKFLSDVSPQNTDSSCMLHMGAMMPLGIDYVYDRVAYRRQRSAHEHVLVPLLARLKQQFRTQLRANKLALSADELAYLLQKLNGVQLRIGNLPLGATSAFYDRYYATANLSAVHFYHNHWEMLHHRTVVQHQPLLLAAGSGRLASIDDYYVNDDLRQVRTAPYFVHQRNLLVVPMMFLQMPFFDHRQGALLQYSLVGWILAHELQHGFERDGVLYDAVGNQNSPLGMAVRQRSRYVAAMRCLERSSPTASLIERMADVNGFQLVYDAYFEQLAAADDTLPATGGLLGDWTRKQLFFLQFAQFFCGALPTAIDHDRDDVRVHEIVANMPEFAAAFQCRVGEREHPAVKCQMWRV